MFLEGSGIRTNTSSRDLKENFRNLTVEEAMAALRALTLSLDETLVYYAEWASGLLFAIDAQNGTTKQLADLTNLPAIMGSPQAESLSTLQL